MSRTEFLNHDVVCSRKVGEPWRHITGQFVGPKIVMANVSELRQTRNDSEFPLTLTRTAGAFERAFTYFDFYPAHFYPREGPRYHIYYTGTPGWYHYDYSHFETRALCYSFGGYDSWVASSVPCPVDMNGKFPKWMRNTSRAYGVSVWPFVKAKCSNRPPNWYYPAVQGFSSRVVFADNPPVVTDDPFDEYTAPMQQVGYAPFVQEWPTHAKVEDFRLMKYPFSSPREIPEVRTAFFGGSSYGPRQFEVDDVVSYAAEVQPNRPGWYGKDMNPYGAYFKCIEAHIGPSFMDYTKWVDITDAVAGYINDISTIPGETYIGEGLIGGYVFTRKQAITGPFTVQRTVNTSNGAWMNAAYNGLMYASQRQFFPNMFMSNDYQNFGFHPDSVAGTLKTYCGSDIYV